MFAVREVFEKAYPGFYRRHKYLSALVIALLRKLWHEDEFQKIKADNSQLEGLALVEAGFKQLNMSLDCSYQTLSKLPKKGPLIIVGNHPTGAIEGLGLLSLFCRTRPDVKLVQGGILRNTLGLYDHSIEVDNLKGAITARAYRQVISHLKEGGAIIMFPAGEVSRYVDGVIQDKTWNNGFLRFAMATHASILPVYLEGKNSPLFYTLGKYCKPLSMLRVVPELLLHRDMTFPVFVGDVIPFSEIEQDLKNGVDEKAIIADIRSKTLSLADTSNDTAG